MLNHSSPSRSRLQTPEPQATQGGSSPTPNSPSLHPPPASSTPPDSSFANHSSQARTLSTPPAMSGTTGNVTSSAHDPLDEPPPYTPRADPLQGETTVEFGPSRPFHPPPPQPPVQPQPSPHPRPTPSGFLFPPPTGSSSHRGRGGLWQQLSEQIDQIANQIERHATGLSSRPYVSPQRTGASWSSYPGQSRNRPSSFTVPTSPASTPAPPLPPRRTSASPVTVPEGTSDFAREFYAAGTGDGLVSSPEENRTSNQTSQNRSPPPPRHPPEERGPTTTPVPGRPLLHDGQLLVYPKGHQCEKCHNTGYKHYDPLRPCKKCWSKYGKPFSGPLAYSYSSSSAASNTQNINLQQPLPQQLGGPPRRQGPPLPRRSTSFSGYDAPPLNGYYPRGPGPMSLGGAGLGLRSPPPPPPPGTIVYRPGDPRIGGYLCWRCNGKGTMNIIIDTINCPICGGCGRTFY